MSKTVVCDVREDLRQGQEPFARIMAAVGALGPDDQLELLVPFEPAPLYQVLGSMGFAYQAERTPEGDWKVTFYRQT